MCEVDRETASAIGPDGRGTNSLGTPEYQGQFFTNPPAGSLGTLQRRQFTGPSVFNMNAAVFKDTRIMEKVSVELRLEALNVFNHNAFAVFSGNLNINSQQFGQVTNEALTPRQLQLGVRVKF